MNRNDITEKIITANVSKGIRWEDVAQQVGLSKEWATAGCLGQMTFFLTTRKHAPSEEFGEGIMSAIDFSMDIVRQPDPKGIG